jgi:hypothetical protein
MMHNDEFPLTMEAEKDQRTGQEHPPIAVGFGPWHVQDDEASAQAGHAVYRDQVFVKIVIPGDRNTMHFQPATDVHKKRFPKAWANYLAIADGTMAEPGLPIGEWPAITRSAALTLRAAHIHTVEALAAVHDGLVDRVGIDGRTLRAKAQAYLAAATSSAETMRLAAEKKELQDQIAAMRRQIGELIERQSAPSTEGDAAPPDDGAIVRRNARRPVSKG